MSLVTCYTPWKHRFSDAFRGYRKRPVAWNGLISRHLTAWKVSKYRLFLVRIFPHSDFRVVPAYLSFFSGLVWKCRSSRWRFSIKKGVLRNFSKFTEKHLCQSVFLIKLQALGLQLYQKRGSGAVAFLWSFRNY